MLAIYKYYLALGKDIDFVLKNWEYLKEAADFIVWCLDNPALSFAKGDVLYGETEAAMNDYTLYANVPCCFGMLFFSEMAKAAGKEPAIRWARYHEQLFRGIDERFSVIVDGKECWDLNHCGFYHDPVLSVLSDFYGYDRMRFPFKSWVIRSENTYRYDVDRYAKDTFASPRGLGYDFNSISQNSLLLDRVDDYSRFVKNLAKTCYAPKFVGRYITPEGAAVLTGRGIYRREGDLGNLAQQSETIKTVLMVCGIAETSDKTIRIMPRMPDKWNFTCRRFRAINSPDVLVNMNLVYHENEESVTLSVYPLKEDQAVIFRAGPFSTNTVTMEIDFVKTVLSIYHSGDSYWADVYLTQYKQGDSIGISMLFTEFPG